MSFYYYAGVTTAKRQPQAGGIQVLACLNEHQCDKTLATAAQAAGPGVRALSEWDAGTRLNHITRSPGRRSSPSAQPFQ
ncbi:hypothetical protein [Kosakonia arachidis]|uniref:hypothetical protein n=1 Tax=Kosakonia arachidis TaxID=551989 RepID=UPI000B7CC50A|nr:hypothetical protein [Kosakonia arachidis]